MHLPTFPEPTKVYPSPLSQLLQFADGGQKKKKLMKRLLNSGSKWVRVEDRGNPCLHIKEWRDIWPAISRVAARHLPRCLPCGLRRCHMGSCDYQLASRKHPKFLNLKDKKKKNTCHLHNEFFFPADSSFLHFMNKEINFTLCYKSYYICLRNLGSCWQGWEIKTSVEAFPATTKLCSWWRKPAVGALTVS